MAIVVDEAIGELLGETVVNSFYVHLNEKGLSRKDVTNKLKLFCSILDETFGIQSLAIQRNIARKLYARLAFAFSPDETKSLLDYVEDAEKTWRRLQVQGLPTEQFPFSAGRT